MKKTIYSVLLFMSLGRREHVKAQVNLVPNPSFEIDTNCIVGGITTATPWNSPTNGTPDLYNTCYNISFFQCGVPSNNFGFQYAHTGNGYAGAAFIDYSPNREYIQVRLDTDLIVNKTYCASFYMSLANGSQYAIKKIGIYFSNSIVYTSTFDNLNLVPQIIDTNFVIDTMNWVHFEGNFTAMGGERYLVIGNFDPSTVPDTLKLWNTGFGPYYYIDDVDVHYCPGGQGVEEESEDAVIKLWPNPSEGIVNIENKKYKIKSVEVYDVLGCEILSFDKLRMTNNETIDISSYASGMYFVEIKTEKGVVRKKVMKE